MHIRNRFKKISEPETSAKNLTAMIFYFEFLSKLLYETLISNVRNYYEATFLQ